MMRILWIRIRIRIRNTAHRAGVVGKKFPPDNGAILLAHLVWRGRGSGGRGIEMIFVNFIISRVLLSSEERVSKQFKVLNRSQLSAGALNYMFTPIGCYFYLLHALNRSNTN